MCLQLFVKIIFQTLCSDVSVHNLDKKQACIKHDKAASKTFSKVKIFSKSHFTTIAWPLRKPLMHSLFVCSIIHFHLSVHLSVCLGYWKNTDFRCFMYIIQCGVMAYLKISLSRPLCYLVISPTVAQIYWLDIITGHQRC